MTSPLTQSNAGFSHFKCSFTFVVSVEVVLTFAEFNLSHMGTLCLQEQFFYTNLNKINNVKVLFLITLTLHHYSLRLLS